ncbi:hypothetical protein K503DRAFT_788030 [Rhizopogon vinicolor AM-OR11-026]|uniref:Uncharacterized protein n=1 Tax=Rhizopogon vinicolor AM-OR11-026 TaxID=1314800 RepID=A0A1B7MEV8_9AGAM|nr:hypothetical protein K503DRAFT_788030 [Rhizopogon vinicolor AM-OR11-026]
MSMAEFYHGEDVNTTRGMIFSLRSKQQLLGVERYQQPPGESPKDRPLPPQRTPAASTPPERSRSSALIRRHTTMTPLGNESTSSHHSQQQSSEHTRLMLEPLTMFENILSRLPNLSASISNLFRSAETIGTNRALEQQIDAEVDDETRGEEPASEIWRRVGGEYRESLRVSDEVTVVRTITGFLLGVDKVMKEASACALDDPGQPHSRNVSFDNEEVSRRTPEVDRSSSRRSQDGRRSVDSRRSWDPSISVVDLSRRISSRAEGVLARPPSSREHDLDLDQPSCSRNTLPPPPREHREQRITSDSIELSLEYEPSPTPAARNLPGGRHRPIPALAIPPPLPALPSESLVRKSTSSLLDKGNRRKPSANTIRGVMTPFPLPSANPTTAVTTHTVSNSDTNASPAPSPAQVRTPLAGSETERDTRRRTIGVRAARASLDSIRDEREVDSGGSQLRTVTLPSQRRERRRTVTEAFA